MPGPGRGGSVRTVGLTRRRASLDIMVLSARLLLLLFVVFPVVPVVLVVVLMVVLVVAAPSALVPSSLEVPSSAPSSPVVVRSPEAAVVAAVVASVLAVVLTVVLVQTGVFLVPVIRWRPGPRPRPGPRTVPMFP